MSPLPTLVLLSETDFREGFSPWSTPGRLQPKGAWSRTSKATPSRTTGPKASATPGKPYTYVEASSQDFDSWSLESPTLNASLGEIRLRFSFHMRFGQAGEIEDGELRVQGWNGALWLDMAGTIEGSHQDKAGDAWRLSPMYTSAGFSNPDFRFRLVMDRGQSRWWANYDAAIDSITITGPAGALVVPPAHEEPEGDVIHVDGSKGHDDNEGTSPDNPKRSIIAAVAAAPAHSTVLVEAGVYRGQAKIGKPGVKLKAKVPGTVIMNVSQEVERWEPDGGGIYSADLAEKPWGGTGDGRFLFPYKRLPDLQTDRIHVLSNVGAARVRQPGYGLAYDSGRVYIRLPDGGDPNKRKVYLSAAARPVVTISKAADVTIDGIVMVGAGDAHAVEADEASSDLTLVNCVFENCRLAVRAQDGLTVRWCEYAFPGFGRWMQDLMDINPEGISPIYAMCKGYNQHRGNAFLEGGMADRPNRSRPGKRALFENNWIHDVFEGHRLGAFEGSVIRGERAENIGDNYVEFEHWQPSSGSHLRVEDCLVINCHDAPWSHQDLHNRMVGPQEVVRCVSLNGPLSRGYTQIKQTGLRPEIKISYAHCYLQTPDRVRRFLYDGWTNRSQRPENLRFINCIVDSPQQLRDHDGKFPQASGNMVAYPFRFEELEGNGGRRVSRRDGLGLDQNLVPKAGSQVVGMARPLPGDVKDSRSDASTTTGPFRPGDHIDLAQWPRPGKRIFTTTGA